MFKRKVLEHIAQDLVTMHFGSEREKSTHGGAVFMERSVRSGRAYFEGSRHGPLDGSRHTRGGSIGGGLWRTGSAMASREGSMRLDASVIGERSVHNGGQLPSGV